MAFIEEMKIAGYRGFGDVQTLCPAIPRDNEKGSGLTIIVGPNNGGKSALLEAIELCNRAGTVGLPRFHRNARTDFFTHLQIRYQGGDEWTLHSDPQSADQLVAHHTAKGQARTPLLHINSRRDLPATITDGRKVRGDYIAQRKAAYTRSPAPDDLSDRVRKWRTGDSRFPKLLERVFDYSFRERPEGGQFTVSIAGMEHDTLGLGDGICSLITLLDGFHDAPNESTILIDEPELSLHPALQRRLFDLLAEESMRLQIIYTTHSPYFVGWDAVSAGATIARVFRHENEYSQIHTLTSTTADKIIKLTKNINNPHILGSFAREALFLEDRVILVEGQEDVVIYKRIADELSLPLAGSFFGWGAGGAGNIETIAAMLQELGYRDVVGIFDGNESSALKRARKSFPDYEFYSIPADNIRDKPSQDKKQSVTGLCSSDGKLREDHVPEIRIMLNQANAFLKRRQAV